MSLVYDKKTFQEQKDNLIMYIMNHGFVEVPEGIKELTGKEQGSISTFHDTVFINNLIPGSYQTTSTGPGHFQATNLDVKYITQGNIASSFASTVILGVVGLHVVAVHVHGGCYNI